MVDTGCLVFIPILLLGGNRPTYAMRMPNMSCLLCDVGVMIMMLMMMMTSDWLWKVFC